MELTWYGTASIALRIGEEALWFDPYVPMPHSPVPVTLRDYAGCGQIFITHGHLDHIASLPDILRENPGATVRCTEAPRRSLQSMGIPQERLIPIAPGDDLTLGGIRVRAYQGRHAELGGVDARRIHRMLHSPARENLLPLLRQHRRCPQNGETLMYQLEAEGKAVQLLGSLNLDPDVTYPTGADLLVLPYNGWADNLPPAQMVIDRLKPRRVVLDHYDDTFPPLTRPIDLTPILSWREGLVTPLRLRETIRL